MVTATTSASGLVQDIEIPSKRKRLICSAAVSTWGKAGGVPGLVEGRQIHN
jgi:hypothetical protein